MLFISLFTFCFPTTDDAMIIIKVIKLAKNAQNFHLHEMFQTKIFCFFLNPKLLIYLKGKNLNYDAVHTKSEEAESWWLADRQEGILYHTLSRTSGAR